MRRTILSFRYVTAGVVLAWGAATSGAGGVVPKLVGGNLVLNTGVTTNVGGVSVAYNGVDHEYRVAWFDSRISGQNDVYAQRVSADGKLLGDNVPIVVGTDSTTDTSIAYDPINNRYLITWRYQGGGPGSPGFNHTYGALASATGGLITSPLDLSNGGLEPTLVRNAISGEFFLEARNFAGGGVAGIRGQRIDANGQPVGGGIAIATTGAPAPAGQVAWNRNANQYLATWRDQTAEDLMGRIINADGALATNPFTISPIFPESGLAASVAFDPINDRYLVIFSRFSAGDILGQFVGPTGTLIGSPFTIVSSPNRLAPFVVYNAVRGVFLLAWCDYGTGELFVLLLDDDGAELGNVLRLNDAGTSAPRIETGTLAGLFLVTWVDYSSSPTRTDVLAQLVAVSSNRVGDQNCDGLVDFGDINPFVLALTNPAGYATAFPYCDIMNGDINADGFVDFGDINPFVRLLTNP